VRLAGPVTRPKLGIPALGRAAVGQVVRGPALGLARSGTKGLGVVSAARIARGTILLEFGGPRIPSSRVTDFSHSIQVARGTFLGPSGNLDDYVNHSCDPNCGLLERDGRMWLVSIRRIGAGTELAFDYSTSMLEEPWEMPCACGSSRCRGVIRAFPELPAATRARYRRLGVVPGFQPA